MPRQTVFEPYFTSKEAGKGSGMGLAVVHGLVETFGGYIRVKSEPEQGTVFRLYFPVLAQTVIASDREEKEAIPTGRERLLLVDDEQHILDIYTQVLEGLGYRVLAVSNGAEGLEAFKASPESFDAIITDQTMPRLTGAELASAVLEIRPEIPILLCTGYSSALSEEKAFELGIRTYLQKPVQRAELATAVRQALDQKGA
nr:response regulator [Desulfogranum mediterraneum]